MTILRFTTRARYGSSVANNFGVRFIIFDDFNSLFSTFFMFISTIFKLINNARFLRPPPDFFKSVELTRFPEHSMEST